MPDQLQTATVGAVVAVRAPGSSELELGLVTSVHLAEIEIAAVSEEISEATDREVLLPLEAVGFAAAVFPSVRGAVLREQLDEVLGSIPDAHDIELGAAAGFDVGPPVLSEADPRPAMRAELGERWTPYWEPVESLRVTRTFGELIALRRATRGVGADALDADSGAIAALERDDPAAFEWISPRDLAGVLRKLAVIVGAEAQGRLRLAFMGSEFPQPQVSYRVSRRGGSASRARQDADRYVEAVRRHLAE